MSLSEGYDLDTAIGSALADAFTQEVFVTKYALVAEILAPDGSRGLTPVISDTCETYEAVGMLEMMNHELKTVYANTGYREMPDG